MNVNVSRRQFMREGRAQALPFKIAVDDKVREIEVKPPPSTLLPTQVEDAASLLRHKNFCLFNDPGTGKTLTVVKAYSDLFFNRAEPRIGHIAHRTPRMVVIAPKVALYQWAEAVLQLVPSARVQIVTKGMYKLPTARSVSNGTRYFPDVIITSYALIARARTLSDVLRLWVPDVTVLDECDGGGLSNLKSVATTKILGPNAGRDLGIIASSPYVWALTGTPVRRYYDGLFPLLKALFPHQLKVAGLNSYWKFVARFCATERKRFGNGRIVDQVVGFKNADQLHDLLLNEERPLAVRRRIEEVAQYLPPITHSEVFVDHETSQELKDATEEALAVKYDPATETTEVNSAISRAARLLGLAKVEEVFKFCARLADNLEDRGILVLFWHQEVGERLHALAQQGGYSSGLLYGKTGGDEREELKQQFNSGELKFLFGQIQSMGTALNLQEGSNTVVFAERTWSPSMAQQAYQRVWRMGQNDHVQVYQCLAHHKIEGMYSSTIEKKTKARKELGV